MAFIATVVTVTAVAIMAKFVIFSLKTNVKEKKFRICLLYS